MISPIEHLTAALAGRYRIVELVGSGGMGAVYRAEHVHMRKAVAVKVLHREMTESVPHVIGESGSEPSALDGSQNLQLFRGSFVARKPLFPPPADHP